MRLLLIDNGKKHTDALQAVCARHEVQTVAADSLDGASLDDYDVLVLSGDYAQGLIWEKPYFLNEVELLRLTDKPVLGIGLGFELICYAYGMQLHEEAEKIAGAAVITPTSDGSRLFQGTDPIKVLENERWAIDELPKELQALAVSDTGVEAVRHKSRPLYGLQLQPEDFKYPSDGKMVFANILDGFGKARLS